MASIILLLILSAGTVCGAFTPKDHYLLRCGSTASIAAADSFQQRTWYPDENATFSSSFSSTTAVSANHDPSNPGSPFTAARIFNSSFTYTFPVSPGPIFLRLYFYPALYSDHFDASVFFITVKANDHLLLSNFSAQLAVNFAPLTLHDSSTDPYVIKEYYLTVPDGNNSLKLTFAPTPPSSYAFVNGIEVVSVPEGLYITDNPVKNLDSPVSFQFPISAALEMVYRLNVGGSEVNVQTDGNVSGMYRHWTSDDPYTFLSYGQPGKTNFHIQYTKLVPNYTAPEHVYQTYKQLDPDPQKNWKLNLTWRFNVDPGFLYMLRFHWCETDDHVNENEQLFDVYINNKSAESDADVMAWTSNQRYVPIYRDYVVSVTGSEGIGGSGYVWITLRPSAIDQKYPEVILNGLEIFKVSHSADGNLDAPNPDVALESKIPPKKVTTETQKRSHLLPGIIGGTIAGVLLTSLIALLLIFKRTKTNEESSMFGTSTGKTNGFFPSFISRSKTSDAGSTLPSHLCRRFSLAQIKLATNHFSEELIIGHGGFGNVYKGMVDGEKGLLAVAIKRLNSSSKQGVHEFKTEIEMLSKLRYIHLVSLIGYCDDSGEMILVYEYMDRGTLRDHLYNTNNPRLSWNQRLNACIGAAKGLQYLHSGASQMIIHRDVKSTNILLDDKWVSKVSDFGLSKLGPIGGDLSHVITAVKGSFGYVDPEYYRFQRLTEKSDVYSFGVVLFEVLCGRAAVNPSLNKEQVNLAGWARSHQRKGALDVIVDPNIKGEIAPACLRKFGEIADRCVCDHGSDRPSMTDVVWSLEFALELQQKADTTSNSNIALSSTTIPAESAATATVSATANASSSTTTNDGFDFSITSGERITRTNSSSALIMSESQDYGVSTSATVFSEICKPRGR